MLTTFTQAALRDGGIDPANLGKGDWLFSISDATNKLGGHVPSVTNENSLMLFYKRQGIRYMIIKAATSDVLFRGCYTFPQFTPYLVNVAHTNGILIFGYNRSYGSNVLGEIAIADYVFNQGADGFVFDAEAEWESNASWIGSNGPAKAWQLCSAVRSNWPTKFLAHAPFPIISFHASFPYKEFGYWCDTVMPQIYHFSAVDIKKSPSAGINWTDVNWYNWQTSLFSLPPTNINGLTVYWTNAIKPLAPINDVYGPPGSSPCEGTTGALPDKDVMEFIDYLSADPNPQTAGGYKGVSFWRTDLHGPVQWAHIKAGTSGDFPGVVNNIVIDDPNAATVGSWTATRTFYNATFFGNGSGTDTNSFGTNYLSRPQGSGDAYVQFTHNIVVAGDYNVYQWHPFLSNASASVPFVINHSAGVTTVMANQTTNAGNWTLLGRFNFAAGTTGYIRVTDAIAEPGSVAIVDGLKLVFIPPTTDLILDNVDAEVGFAGSWQTGVTSPDKYQDDYRFASTVAGGLSNAIYRPYLSPAGLYEVYIWYPQGANRATNAPWTVFYDGGSVDVPVDQTVNGGGWRLLTAAKPFQAGTNGYVRLSNDTGYSGKVVLADAVRFVRVDPPHLDTLMPLAGGKYRLEIVGPQGHYGIEGSTNLLNWAELTNIVATNSPFEFIDVETNLATRFYRVRLVP